MKKLNLAVMRVTVTIGLFILNEGLSYATPSTHIWAPSTDIQSYGKIHITSDFYFPVDKKDKNNNQTYTGEVYGLTFGLLSDNQDKNPLGRVMAEVGFDYKKGYGPSLDTYPWYFNFKLGIPEGTYFDNMPAFAIGGYDLGTKHNITDNDIWYLKSAKTVIVDEFSLGRFSLGYFWGNGKLLLDKEGNRDNNGIFTAWERTMTEISDRLWICTEYQETNSSYGAFNLGFSWQFTKNTSCLLGYQFYNNKNLSDTVTVQLDINY